MRRLKLFAIIAAVLVTVGIQQTKVVSAAEKTNSKVQMDNVDTRNLDNTVVLGVENKVNGVAQDKKADANKNLNAAVDVNAHVKVGMFNGSTSSSSNSINPKFKVTNTGSSSIKLSSLKLRYYYTSDDNKEQSFWCDYAATTSGTYTTLTSNVTGVFGKLDQAVTNADSYLEIGFNEAAGTLEAGQTMEIQTRVSKVDWSNYTQSNDYSFDSKDSNYVESDKVTATLNGTTLWGIAPDGKVTTDPVITPESATFDKYVKKAADINIGVKFNDNVLKALRYYNGTSYVPMVKEKDYIITDAGVTLSKDFLSTLPLGKTAISFDFDKASSKVVTIEVINSTPSSVITPTSSVYDQSKKADIPVTITFNDNTLVSINDGKKDLTAGTDYILKDNVATLTQAYLDTLPAGDTVLTFKFSAGDVQKLTVTVKPVVMNLNVVIGNATGKAGTTVVVPVTVKGITKNGMNACTFTLSYDKNLFENVKVTPGDICVNPDATFIPSVDAANGLINIFYCDSTGEELEAILKDGLFFNISFDIKNGLKSQSSDVKVSDPGNFVDTKSAAYSLNYTNGSISIVGEQVVNSAITPTSSVYDQGNKADIPVTITYNGNTLVSINDGKKDLTAGTDYILTDNVATLTQAYLDTLPAGDTVLTFKFSAGDVQKLTVTVKPVVMNLNIVIGNATGKAGTTVVVPVTVKGITKNGMNACTFTLSYDKNLFENVKVTPGDICVNPDATFIPSVDAANGLISIFYCDSTGEELEAILKDGLFFNISFDIKTGLKSQSSDVKVSDQGNFVDTKSKAYSLNYTNGSISIVGEQVVNSAITPTSSVYDQGNKADIPVTITYNGNTLVSINDGKKDLTAGTDYILKDNVATLTQAYLDTLPVGDTVLTFKFSAGDAQKLTVTVKPVVMNLNVVIGNATGKAGTTVVVPVTLKGITKNGMNACTCVLSYDKSLLENVKVTPGDICVNPDATFIASVDEANGLINIFYCDSTGEELEAILKDGLFFNISFDIKAGAKEGTTDVKVSDPGNFVDTKSKGYVLNYTNGSVTIVGVPVDKFSTNIGAVEGKAGDTLIIPVSLKNIPASGISSLDLKFKYDSNLIDIVSVAPGSIIANPKANFSYYDNKNNNLLSMSFLDFEATGKDLIKSSGDLVYITVKIKDTATPGVTKLSDNGETNFGDADGKDLVFVLNNGTITIH